MVRRREPERDDEEIESGVVPEDWRPVRDWLREAHAREAITSGIAVRTWIVMSFLNAFYKGEGLPSPDSLELYLDGSTRVAWEVHPPHQFAIIVSAPARVEVRYANAATGATWGQFCIGGLMMTEEGDHYLRLAAGLPLPPGEDPSS